MKKKILAITLVCALGLFAVSCGNSADADKDSQIEDLKAENTELKKQLKELQTAIEENVGEDINSNDSIKELQEMKLNEPFDVKTDNGTYRITMQGAEMTDWYRENDGKNVIALKYEVENVDFKTGELTDGKDGCLIDHGVFKVSSPDGYILDMWNSTMSAYGFPDIVEPGFKAKEELPYIVEGVPEYVDVVFYRCTGDIAKIKIDVTK